MKNDAATSVHIVLDHLKINPKELALRLGVSLRQVNKWQKNTEMLPYEIERKLEEFIGVGIADLAWAGTPEALKKWQNLFGWIAAAVGDDEASLFGKCELELLTTLTIHVLDEMGMAAPKTFPPELDEYHYQEGFGPEEWAFSNEDSPWITCIYLVAELYRSYAVLEKWYIEYLFPFHDTDEEFDHDLLGNIQSDLLGLAAAKFDADKVFAEPFAKTIRQLTPKFYSFARETKATYRRWLTKLKIEVIKSGTPLQVELFDLLTRDDNELFAANEDDDEDCDDNQPQHPDIYINELLNNTREILALLRKERK
jgi:hypothetical protein